MFISLVFPLFFQIFDFVMAGRRIVRLSEAPDSLQIFFETSMWPIGWWKTIGIVSRSLETFKIKFYIFFGNVCPGGSIHLYGAREILIKDR